MSGASDTLDPVATAERDIAGSKDLMASVARDLGQHQRWLEQYKVAEERRARRIRLQALIDRLRLRGLLFLRRSKRLALITLNLALSAALSVARTAAKLFTASRRQTAAGVRWLRPRAYKLARGLWRWLTAVWVWILSQSRSLAATTLRVSSRLLARLAAQSRALAVTLRRARTAFGAWTLFHAKQLARSSVKVSAFASSWVMARSRDAAAKLQALGALALLHTMRTTRLTAAKSGPVLSRLAEKTRTLGRGLHTTLLATSASVAPRIQALGRMSAAGAAAGLSGIASNAKRLLPSDKREQRVPAHRAVAIRRSTALIRFDPKQNRLPFLRAS